MDAGNFWLKLKVDEIKTLQNTIILQQNRLNADLESLSLETALVLAHINDLVAYVDDEISPALEAEIKKSMKLTRMIDEKVPDKSPSEQ